MTLGFPLLGKVRELVGESKTRKAVSSDCQGSFTQRTPLADYEPYCIVSLKLLNQEWAAFKSVRGAALLNA